MHNVGANVVISEVLYDPLTSEFDTEYVELFNQGESNVDIGGWMLNTTSVQATIPIGTTILYGKHFLIADDDDNSNWPSEWPEPDYSGEEITLGNTNSGVQLVDSDGNVIDVVGWGSPLIELYEGTPHASVSPGTSLTRVMQNGSYVDTQNNADDFIESAPSPSNTDSGSDIGLEIELSADVHGNSPIIEYVNVSPDELALDGVQLYPSPGNNKEVLIDVIVTDSDGYDDISEVRIQLDLGTVTAEFDLQLNDTSALFKGIFNMSYYYAPGNYSITILAEDNSELNSSYETNFEFLGLIAFDLDVDGIAFGGNAGAYSQVLGDLDMLTLSSPTIRNIGNLPLDFQVYGTDLNSEFDTISVENVEYTFLDNDFNSSYGGVLSTLPVVVEVNLMPGEDMLRELTTRLFIPIGASMGAYTGSMSIIGLES